MLANKQPFDEAKSKLGDKIIDVKSKTVYLHKIIDEISLSPIANSENLLKEVVKKDFFSNYIKVSQELEGCLGRLLLILDTVGSLGVTTNDEQFIAVKSNLNVSEENSKPTLLNAGTDNNAMAQMVPLITSENTSSGINNVSDFKATISNDMSNYIHQSSVDNKQTIKKFKRNSSQEKSHERVTCHLCGKTVRGNYELKVHLACRHTSESKDELKYVCMLCTSDPKRYARGDRLKEHIERIHLNISNKHVCTLCGRGFNRPGRRNKHQMHCKGVEQDVEVIITDDNVLVSSNLDDLGQSSRNNDEITMKVPLHGTVRKKNQEETKDAEIRFYNETIEGEDEQRGENSSKIVKQEDMDTDEVKVYFTTSIQRTYDESDSSHVTEGDTLHISDNDTITDNEPSDSAHIVTSTESNDDNSSAEDHPVHIMSNRNSMVM